MFSLYLWSAIGRIILNNIEYVQIFQGCNFQAQLKSSFIFKGHLISTLELHIHGDCLKNFKDLIFVDDKLKQQKLYPSRICMYTVTVNHD